ncbi:MAG: hypothetical protein E6I23_11335 [Chloroflexi bacterium]|nr:MAG: hypothetical protein E6I23_11335 [Chloroflexota bacterium]
MHAIAAYGGLQQAMRSQENKTMSINPVRRPLSVATPSAPPPVFAIASGYEPRSIPAEAYERERGRRKRIAPAAIAILALITFGVVAVLIYRLRSDK